MKSDLGKNILTTSFILGTCIVFAIIRLGQGFSYHHGLSELDIFVALAPIFLVFLTYLLSFIFTKSHFQSLIYTLKTFKWCIIILFSSLVLLFLGFEGPNDDKFIYVERVLRGLLLTYNQLSIVGYMFWVGMIWAFSSFLIKDMLNIPSLSHTYPMIYGFMLQGRGKLSLMITACILVIIFIATATNDIPDLLLFLLTSVIVAMFYRRRKS